VTACDDEGCPVGVEVVSSYMETDLEEEARRPSLWCNPPEFLEEDWQANLARMSPAEVECMFHCLPPTSPVYEYVRNQYITNEMEAGVEEEEERNYSKLSVVGI